jgi:uridylate kinase
LGKNSSLKYGRILLKISGEAIEGDATPFDLRIVERLAEEIGGLQSAGVEVGIVIGGGNILRGASLSRSGIDRVGSDYMGMLATLINGLLLENVLQAKGVAAVLQSALAVDTVAEGIVLKKTRKYLSEKTVVVFAAGTGRPYVTTDTAAALRGLEIGADVLLKATKVDGVYDRDPVAHAGAVLYKRLSYDELLAKKLQVMDMAAVSMCRDHNLPIVVFNIFRSGSVLKIVEGDEIGTIIECAG